MYWSRLPLIGLVSLLAACAGEAASAGDSGGPPSTPSDPFDDSWMGDEVGALTDGRWSNPTTWASGRVPGEGDRVVIEEGTTVYLDTETAPLYSLDVKGTLVADPVDVALTAETIRVEGLLQIGTEEAPFTNRAVITLTGQSGGNELELAQGMGRRLLGVLPGGQLELHGEAVTSWTRLTATVNAGSDVIEVEEAQGWDVGDRVALTPSHYRWDETDVRTIAEVLSPTRFRLDEGVDHYHFGEMQEIEGWTVDERAEVGLLSRNVVVRGEESTVESALGGHMMFMEGSTVRISGIEATRLGQRGVLGRYPIHWHLARDASGDYVRDSAIHHNFQRCVTVHNTQNLRIENNFAFDTFGHCYFFEDAVEVNNTFVRNVGAMVRLLPEEDRVENPSLDDGHKDRFDDKHDRRSSVFWITNPNNHFIDNVAAGAEHGMGFWFDIQRGEDDVTGEDVKTNDEPLGTFDGNVAHSISSNGRNNHGYGPLQAGSCLTFEGLGMRPEAGESYVTDFTAYKCHNHGIWALGGQYIDGAILIGNRVGIGNTHFSQTARLVNALIAGESANRPGASLNAEDPPSSLSFSGPKGAEFIKGTTALENVTFIGFGGLHDQNVAMTVDEQYSKYDQWFSGITLVDSLPIVVRSDDSSPPVLLPDLDGSLTGSIGTLMMGEGLDAVIDGSCAPMDSDYAGMLRCPYVVSMLDVGGDRDSGAANGVRFVHADGAESDVGDGDGMREPIRTAEHTRVTGLDAGQRYELSSRIAPSTSVRIVLESGDHAFLYHRDRDRSGGHPDLDLPVPQVEVDALDAVERTSYAIDPSTGEAILQLFGWDRVFACTNTECD